MRRLLCGFLVERQNDDRRAVANYVAGTGWSAQRCKESKLPFATDLVALGAIENCQSASGADNPERLCKRI